MVVHDDDDDNDDGEMMIMMILVVTDAGARFCSLLDGVVVVIWTLLELLLRLVVMALEVGDGTVMALVIARVMAGVTAVPFMVPLVMVTLGPKP